MRRNKKILILASAAGLLVLIGFGASAFLTLYSIDRLGLGHGHYLAFRNQGVFVDLDFGFAIFSIVKVAEDGRHFEDCGRALLRYNPDQSVAAVSLTNNGFGYQDFSGDIWISRETTRNLLERDVDASSFCVSESWLITAWPGEIGISFREGISKTVCAPRCRSLLGCGKNSVLFVESDEGGENIVLMTLDDMQRTVVYSSSDMIIPYGVGRFPSAVLFRDENLGKFMILDIEEVTPVSWLQPDGWGIELVGHQIVAKQLPSGLVALHEVTSGEVRSEFTTKGRLVKSFVIGPEQ
jgi:hypothetical protein